MLLYGNLEDVDTVYTLRCFTILSVSILISLLGVNTAAWLAQLGERRSAEREVAGSNPGRTNTQGL